MSQTPTFSTLNRLTLPVNTPPRLSRNTLDYSGTLESHFHLWRHELKDQKFLMRLCILEGAKKEKSRKWGGKILKGPGKIFSFES